MLAVVLPWPVTAPLLVIPVIVSVMIVRLRTVADGRRHRAHAVEQPHRRLVGDRRVCGSTRVHGRARELTSGEDLRLPAVTFATLPLLSEVSGGRVPNPYTREAADSQE